MSEKSPLPAIVVTPSSPSSSGDFSIAFLAPAPKPSLFQRLTSSLSSPTSPTYPNSPIALSLSDTDSEAGTPPPSSSAFHIPSQSPSYSSLSNKLQLKARTSFLLLLLFFILACHLLTHRLATRIPHLEFGNVRDLTLNPGTESATNGVGSWWDWNTVWGEELDADVDAREFVIREGGSEVEFPLEAEEAEFPLEAEQIGTENAV